MMDQRIGQSINTGNAQSMGLRLRDVPAPRRLGGRAAGPAAGAVVDARAVEAVEVRGWWRRTSRVAAEAADRAGSSA